MSEALAEPQTWPQRVLVVDDDASIRSFLRAVIEHGGLAVAGEADNGRSAVEQARSLQPDVVLLDLSMPQTDGASALGAILRAAPGAQVIVLSGMPATAAAPLLDAGATAFLSKGLAPAELLDRLAGIIGSRPGGARPARPATGSAGARPPGTALRTPKPSSSSAGRPNWPSERPDAF